MSQPEDWAEQLLETGHSTLIRFAPVSDEDDEVDE